MTRNSSILSWGLAAAVLFSLFLFYNRKFDGLLRLAKHSNSANQPDDTRYPAPAPAEPSPLDDARLPSASAEREMIMTTKNTAVEGDKMGRLEGTTGALRKCILATMPPSRTVEEGKVFYKNLTVHLKDCISRFTGVVVESLDSFHMGRFGEHKHFVPPVNSTHAGLDCNFLTIGIGGDWKVEEEVKLKYPHCKIYGIEPSKDQYADFEKCGTVIPFGVGVTPGKAKLKIRKGTGYEMVDVDVVPLYQLLDQYVASRTVLYSTIDIEGFEYDIVGALRRGHPFAKEKVRICQMDVEFHTLGWKPSDYNFAEYFYLLMTETSYLPIIAGDFFSHKKVTLLETKDQLCETIFAFSKLFRAQNSS